MLRLFLDNRIGVLILLPFFLLLYLLGDIIGTAPFFGAPDQPAFVSIPNWSYWSVVCFQFAILLLNALTFNWVFNSQEFLEKNTYIISLNYLIFSSFFIDFGHFSWTPVIHTCCMLMLAVFFGVRPQNDARKAGFNAGFLFGIALLFNSQLLLLVPALLIMLIVLRTLQIRELLLLLLGLTTPILLLYAAFYVADQTFLFPYNFNLEISQLHWFEITVLVLLHILLILSLIGLRARLLKASLRLKKQIQVLNVFTFFTWFIGLSAIILVSQTSLLSLLVLPLSFYFAYALLSSSLGISSHLFFYLFLLSTLLKFVVLSF
ncbi:MAG: hypothetical protein ACKOWW_09285 [Flavobacteriales bacterium]